jgi:hypothetical protein
LTRPRLATHCAQARVRQCHQHTVSKRIIIITCGHLAIPRILSACLSSLNTLVTGSTATNPASLAFFLTNLSYGLLLAKPPYCGDHESVHYVSYRPICFALFDATRISTVTSPLKVGVGQLSRQGDSPPRKMTTAAYIMHYRRPNQGSYCVSSCEKYFASGLRAEAVLGGQCHLDQKPAYFLDG